MRLSGKRALSTWVFLAQRGVVLRIVSTYWTVSTSAVLVLASVPPIDLLAEERKETFQLRKELTCLTNLQEIARAKEAIRKDGRRRLVEKWQRAHNSLLTRWSPSCTSLNKYGCLSSHSSPWWWRRGTSMDVRSAATTRASRNRIGACTRGPASWAD